MKKTLIIIILLGMMCQGVCQPPIYTPSFPSSINLFDKFEVSFYVGNAYSNPYDSAVIFIEATFISPDNNSYQVSAFYYERYTFTNSGLVEHAQAAPQKPCWKIRFTPDQVGTWTFTIQGTDANGTTYMPNNGTYSFSCNTVNNVDGFISKANNRFLRRDAVINGQRKFKSFFPIGPNIAWYDCFYVNHIPDYSQPYGIYDYKRYIDSLSGNANYMRIWLNRYQYLSLYGPEYAQRQGDTIVYFDSTINQKDSAELDFIIEYAAQHGVSIMPCIFSFGDFRGSNEEEPNDPSVWSYNPFNYRLNLQKPCDFFTDANAKFITKNLLRYIVSRWGYATNIMCWELWNEVSNMFKMCDDGTGDLQDNVLSWHNEMASYIRSCDPYKHCVSTSMGTTKKTYDTSSFNHNYPLYSHLFDTLDIVLQHNYQNIQKAKSAEQFSKVLYDKTSQAHTDYSTKPFFMSEFGFGQSHGPSITEKDSCGVDLHNSLWSSLFSTAIGPASLWWWAYLKNCHLYHNRYAPLLTFCQSLPILSETFTPHQTGYQTGTSNHILEFPNNIETYYMINATEDTIYGWCQDTAFAYQSLRWLTDSVRFHRDSTGNALHFVDGAVFDTTGYVYTLDLSKRPGPSFNSNLITIPINNQSVGSEYTIKWYNTETGLQFSSYVTQASVYSDSGGSKYVSFAFPSFIRNIAKHHISNTFGDVVFAMFLTENTPGIKKKQPISK